MSMDDRLRDAGRDLRAKAARVRVPNVKGRSGRRLLWRGVVLAGSVGALAVVLIWAAGLTSPPSEPDAVAGPGLVEVDYLQLRSEINVDVPCTGMSVRDNGGFNTVLVDVWGPNAEDRYAMLLRFPDGATYELVWEGHPWLPSRIWADTPPPDDLLREVDCVQEDEGATSSLTIINRLLTPRRGQLGLFGPFISSSAPEQDEFVDMLRTSAGDPTSQQTGDGTPVDIFTSDRSVPAGEYPALTQRVEWWFNPDDLVVKYVNEFSQLPLASGTETIAVLARTKTTIPDSRFAVAGKALVSDVSAFDNPTETTEGEPTDTPMGSRLLTVEVGVEGSEEIRFLSVYEALPDGICVVYGGGQSCGLPDLGGIDVASSVYVREAPLPREVCVVGLLAPTVESARLRMGDGSETPLEILEVPDSPLGVFIRCWIGDDRASEIEILPTRPPQPTISVTDEVLESTYLIWVNEHGLIQLDADLWRVRLNEACTRGVWNPDVAVELADQYLAEDESVSARSDEIGPPAVEDAANTLWVMAVQVCRDWFPEGALDAGPPFGGSTG